MYVISTRVLLTGGTGFIGLPLVRRLFRQGHEVLIYDAFPNARGLGEDQAKIQLVKGDITDWTKFYDACKQFSPDWIVHLAGLYGER